ncbi:hypothetical protein [Pontibacter akesuensis]|uniref:Uncharacterized protein n=1 Tax=Pontibacter akesuensis TaxID=388950 RepID=A0A1I7GTJ1_9BACT|nr:hypothetical protein [Pontibacter akesuensis]GHA55143.1 hypothetical protein GCM10007389_03170 [Pontibacter akesuensis]SFU51755.1 hypothetical protein SAMN04487941_1259 [Pontibacter akesuensis]
MERNERNRYYQQNDENRMDRDYDRNAYRNNYYGRGDNDYGRDQDNRRWIQESREDFRERGVLNNDNNRFQDYRSRDYDMERNYRDNTRGQQGRLGDIRQGYGISSFDQNSDRYGSGMNNMQRERNSQMHQGYGSGRMSGYSGSRFGGSNYSSDGDFGGSSNYDSMSGTDGNMDRYVSTSGYGGGDNDNSGYGGRGSAYGSSDYGMGSNRYGSRNNNRRDRGGYFNEDRNR